MKKSLFFAVLSIFILIAVFAFTKGAETKTRSYYSGDAISFNDKVYVGSTNSGYLEVFRLDAKVLTPLVKMKNYNPRFNKYDDFYDLKFNEEGGKLYLYAISGYTLYKYEIKTNNLELISENTNTYWEWYNRVDKFGDNIVTISASGIKIWNNNLEVINSHNYFNTTTPYNLRASNNAYISNVDGDYLEIYDTNTRSLKQKIAINFFQKPNNHKTYQDASFNTYVVDDYYAKKFSLDGKLLASFRHLDYEGYDISSSGNAYIYFSNGMGVVKLLAADMTEKDYTYTYNLAGGYGWAMGLNVVKVKGQDNVVVFNGSSILVLDHNLDQLAFVLANEKEDPYPTENLFLNLDHYATLAGAEVNLSGGGYLPEESLSIDFAGTKTSAKADHRGRFVTELIVPSKKGMVDIKVIGDNSKLSYSSSFNILEKK